MTEFNFPKIQINTIDVSDQEMNRLQKVRSFIGPGTHSLKITALENRGPNKTDHTFQEVSIKLEAPNGGHMLFFLSIPTVRLKFQGGSSRNSELYPFQKLCKFFEGLGETFTQKDVPALITKYFTKNTLLGRVLTGVVGYSKMHLVYLESKYVLVARDGSPLITDTGSYVVSDQDRDAALASAVTLGFDPSKIQKYPEILNWIADTTLAVDDTEF